MKKINAIVVTNSDQMREIQNKDPDFYNYMNSFANVLSSHTGYYSSTNHQRYTLWHSKTNFQQLLADKEAIQNEDIENAKPKNVLIFKNYIPNYPEDKIQLLRYVGDRIFYRQDEHIKNKWTETYDEKTSDDITYVRFETFNDIWTETNEEDQTASWFSTNIGSLMLENLDAIDLTGENFNQKWENSKINFLTTDQLKEIAETEDDKKYKMYNLSNLYRGSTETKYDLVPKSKIGFAKGYKIALAKVKTTAYVDGKDTQVNKYIWVSNVPAKNFNKYTKCRKFFAFFQKRASVYSGSFFFKKEEYEEKMSKRFGKNNVYTNFIEKVFGENQESFNTVRMHENVNETTFNPTTLSIFGQIKKAQKDNKYIAYQKTKQKLEEFTAKVDRLNSSKNTIERRKTRIARNVERLEEELRNHKSSLIEVQKEEKEIQVNLPGYIEAKDKLSDKIEKKKEEYNSYIKTITLDNLQEDKYVKNFKNQGIVIDKVVYREKDSGNDIELKNNSEIVLESLKADTNLTLSEIVFRITKPVTIYVDRAEKGENCKKIIGGPYLIRVDHSSLDIGILSSASILGYNPSNSSVWVHPHTSPLAVNRENATTFFDTMLKNGLRRACLGEAQPAIYAGFKSKDIRQVIIASMSWVTNANSSDAWGKHYKYFPKPEEILSREFEITKQFIDLQTMEEKLMSTDSVFNLLSDSLTEEVQQIENEEIADNQQFDGTYNDDQPYPNEEIEPEQEMVFQLRRAGVPNYQPYNTTEN